MSNTNTAPAAMQTVKIQFHSFSGKIAFCASNGIMPSEILSEGPGWIEIADRGECFANNVHVFCIEANTLSQIAADLNKIAAIQIIGTRKDKAKAARHRKACFAEIKKMNQRDGLAGISIEELMAELA